MYIRLPILFRAEVVHKGKRKPVYEHGVEWHECQLNILDDKEAPIATEWLNKFNNRVQTRWYDNNHWIHETNEHDIPLSKQNLLDLIGVGDTENNPILFGAQHVLASFIAGDLKPFDKNDYREVISSDREAVISKLESNIRNTIIVGDSVWRRSFEPAYKYERGKSTLVGDVHHIRPSIVEITPSSSYQGNSIYRADAFEDFKLAVAGRTSVHQSTVPDEYKILVFIPESIKHNPDIIALQEVSKALLKSVQQYLGSYSTSQIRAWCDFTDAYDKDHTNHSESAGDRLAAAADTFIAGFSDNTLYHVGELKTVLDRWNNRQITIDDDYITNLGM